MVMSRTRPSAPVTSRRATPPHARVASKFSRTLAAPAIAAAAEPGQFVMVKPGAGSDPLLRRPFSVFDVLRDNPRFKVLEQRLLHGGAPA